MMVWLALAGEARAACDTISMMRSVEAADRAFSAMDAEAFSTAVVEVDATLECATDAVSPTHVVAVHRTHALAAFFAGDDAEAVSSFRAALATMPGFQLSSEIAPIGHPLRERFEEARLFADEGTVELAPPAEGWITIDGRRSTLAPAGRPFVFQQFLGDGTIAATVYVAVGRPVPTYPTKPADPPISIPQPVPAPVAAAPARLPDPVPVAPPPQRKGPKTAPLVLGISLDLVAAGLYGGAFLARDRYDEAVLTGTEDRIKTTHLATNTLVGGSIGAAILGTSLVLVSF